jgi:Co/Zn/Cd efflux system component
MIIIGCLAFVANVTCLLLLAKHRSGAIHMRASWIFSTNDVIANVGLIISGLLVMWSGSRIPDLVIGAIVSVVVIQGGRLILQEASSPRESL